MKKTIIVSGSLAYDRIMDFPGHFHEHILPDKIRTLNVAFQVNGVREKFGGTAGNIAYALFLMGQKPVISATIGRDYHRYFEWFAVNAIPMDKIKVIDDEFTASAYITTDLSDNQITGFNPGAMKYSSELDFDALDPEGTILIVSPGNLDDMVSYPQACKVRGIEYIFDPGQSLPMLSREGLMEAIEGSKILISNDYELNLIMTKTGLGKEALLDLTGAIITTRGRAWIEDTHRRRRSARTYGQSQAGARPYGCGRFIPGRTSYGSGPGKRHRGLRENGECLRLFLRRMRRHPGVQVRPRRVRRRDSRCAASTPEPRPLQASRYQEQTERSEGGRGEASRALLVEGALSSNDRRSDGRAGSDAAGRSQASAASL